MSLIKSSFLNGIAVFVKIICSLVLNKILAVYVGPSGYALIGKFQNIISVISNLAGGIFVNGVTKYTAEHADNELLQHNVWKTAIQLSLAISVVLGLIVFILRDYLSDWLLYSKGMSSIFIWLVFALPILGANNILLAIINGKKEIFHYVYLNIIGSIFGLLIIGVLSYKFGIYGALVAFTINPAIILIFTTYTISQKKWFKYLYIVGSVNKKALKDLLGYGLMGVTATLCLPVALIIIRDQLTNKLGLDLAGYWQAIWKISEIYLMVITSTMVVYYLPRIAEIRYSTELKREIKKVYLLVLPFSIIGAAAIFILKDYIIEILFTLEFRPMRELFAWQLIGDIFRMGSWVLAYILLGRSMIKIYMLTEILFTALFVFLSYGFLELFGLKGVPIAYSVNYFTYWIFLWYVVSNEIKKMPSEIY